mgnify:CR=1 FL=1
MRRILLAAGLCSSMALALPDDMPGDAKATPTLSAPAAPVLRVGPRQPCARGCLNPVEAVSYANYLAPRAGVAAEFEMEVKAVGGQRGRFFLNSETDYRDRNCLTLVLTPMVAKAMAGSADVAALEKRFKGKRIAVEGIARRVRIDFTDDTGKASGKYYYQVHVVVMDARQIVEN